MNFGEWGIVVGMLCLALLYNFLNGFFNNKNIKGIGKIYAIAVIFVFIYHEGNLTMTFGNVPLLSLSIYAICRLFQLPYFEKLWIPKKRSLYYDGYYPYWSEFDNPFSEEKSFDELKKSKVV
jgi:hypothetical protein